MTNLTRSSLSSSAYLESLGLPKEIIWSTAQIESSLAETLQRRPAGEFWVFAYGSLMWNPLLHFDKRRVAKLKGWRRSFCLELLAGRGSSETPGRMLALEPGGETSGIALRLHEDSLPDDLHMLWRREMVAGAYQPLWADIELSDGTHTSALVFVADPTRPQYDGESSVEAVAPLIAAASGSLGSNVDYVYNLDFALADSGLADTYIADLVNQLKVLCAGQRPGAPACTRLSARVTPDRTGA